MSFIEQEPEVVIEGESTNSVLSVTLRYRNTIIKAGRDFSIEEKNLSIFERDLITIIFAFEKWESFLLNKKITIYSDNSTLVWAGLRNMKRNSLPEYANVLNKFDIEWEYSGIY